MHIAYATSIRVYARSLEYLVNDKVTVKKANNHLLWSIAKIIIFVRSLVCCQFNYVFQQDSSILTKIIHFATCNNILFKRFNFKFTEII